MRQAIYCWLWSPVTQTGSRRATVALATVNDVTAALGNPPSGDVDALLETASDLVIGYLYPCPIPDPTPPAISRVVADMVATAVSGPGPEVPVDVKTMGYGPFTVGFADGATSRRPFLTAALKQRLAPFRCGNGMTSMPLGSERS